MKLPALQELTTRLRAMHKAFAHPDGGGEYVCLVPMPADDGGARWEVRTVDDGWLGAVGREYVPGDGLRFDAVAAARRLLAAARDGGES